MRRECPGEASEIRGGQQKLCVTESMENKRREVTTDWNIHNLSCFIRTTSAEGVSQSKTTKEPIRTG